MGNGMDYTMNGIRVDSIGEKERSVKADLLELVQNGMRMDR